MQRKKGFLELSGPYSRSRAPPRRCRQEMRVEPLDKASLPFHPQDERPGSIIPDYGMGRA